MPTASTNGWDNVFAIKFPNVNSAIVNAGASPASFTFTDTSSSGTITVDGTFGAWQLTTGGDAENLHMNLPITSGNVDNAGSNTPYSDATADIEVKLDLLPQPGATSTSGPNNLQVDPTTVSVLGLTFTGTEPDVVTKALINQGLEEWLLANIQEFNHVFATVDLSMKVDDTPEFNWLMPTHTSYAVEDAATVDDAIFAVLSMTENRSAAILTHEVSPDAIPTGAPSGYLISTERFLEKIVLPGVPVFFNSSSTADFDITQDGTQVSNNKKLIFGEFTLKNGSIVTADIEQGGFTITVEGSNLIMDFERLHYSPSDGIDVHINFTQYSVMELDASGRIDLKPTTFIQSGTVSTSVGVQVAEIIAGVVIEVITIVIGVGIGAWLEDAAEVGNAIEDGVELSDDTSASMSDVSGTYSLGATDANTGIAQEGTSASDTADDEVNNVSDGGNEPAEFTGWLQRGNVKLKVGLIAAFAGLPVSAGIGSIAPIMKAVADGNKNDVPTLLDFADTAVSPVTWPNAADYTLTSAALNESLQIGGDPGFS